MKKKIFAVLAAACISVCPLALAACGDQKQSEPSHDIISSTEWEAAFDYVRSSDRYLWTLVAPIDTNSVLTADTTTTERFGQNYADFRFMYSFDDGSAVTEHWYYQIEGVFYDYTVGGSSNEISEDDFISATGDIRFEPFLFDFASQPGRYSYEAYTAQSSSDNRFGTAYVTYRSKSVELNVIGDPWSLHGTADIDVMFSEGDKSLLCISATVTENGKTYRYELSEFGTYDIAGFEDVIEIPFLPEDPVED